MFITDQRVVGRPLPTPPKIFQLSREGAPLYVSVVGEDTLGMFLRLERALLEDPRNRGVAHLFQVMLYFVCVGGTVATYCK